MAGNLIVFNPNGAWSWYQDERVLIDQANNSLLVGSVGATEGAGGAAKGGDIDVASFRMSDGRRQIATLHDSLEEDDHNLPALLIRPDGRYLAAYTKHNSDRYTYFRVSTNPHDATSWQTEQTYNWRLSPSNDFNTTYSNLFYLPSEDRTYDFARANNRSPNMLISSDQGATWTYGGKLLFNPVNVGYVNGYLKYASNGYDQIHFIATEHHPRDFNTSIYHGYIQGGQMFRSDGSLLDSDIFDNAAFHQTDLTPVFISDPEDENRQFTRAWTTDLALDAYGRPYGIFTVRADDIPTNTNGYNDHRFFYARYDGAAWHTYQLAKAGPRLYTSEQDYTGLVALHPHDPNTLYISTPIDPRDDVQLSNHEIFKGVTSDGGAHWSWSPLTWNSGVDNLRPIIPAWDADDTAVVWFRGTYSSMFSFDSAVVGVIDKRFERLGAVHYVDASAANTRLASGAALAATGPSATRGVNDGSWHWRTGFGNGGSVLTSNEQAEAAGTENAPALKTTLTGLATGAYDVFAYFWANPAEDWRIQAGLSADSMVLFRERASQQAEASQFSGTVTLVGGGSTALYRAYVGRVNVTSGSPLDVFIDDMSTTLDGKTRTWFDGIGYAPVLNLSPADLNADGQLNFADFQALISGLHGSLAGLPRDAAFARGDINADGQTNFADFQQFRSEYVRVHGEAAFAALTRSVPEPRAFWMALAGLIAAAARTRMAPRTALSCRTRREIKKASSSSSTRPFVCEGNAAA